MSRCQGWAKKAVVIFFLVSLASLQVSCSKKDNVNSRNDSNTGGFNPFPTDPFGQPIPGGGNPVPGNGPIINDAYSSYVNQALASVPCPNGRLQVQLAAPANAQFNRIYGPFSQSSTGLTGSVVGIFVGANPTIGDVMAIRRIGSGNQVTGFHMELHLCIDNILVAPNRSLSNFRLRTQTPIIIDLEANCSVVGPIDWAAAVMDAAPVSVPGFPTSGAPSPVFISITKIQSANFCSNVPF